MLQFVTAVRGSVRAGAVGDGGGGVRVVAGAGFAVVTLVNANGVDSDVDDGVAAAAAAAVAIELSPPHALSDRLQAKQVITCQTMDRDINFIPLLTKRVAMTRLIASWQQHGIARYADDSSPQCLLQGAPSNARNNRLVQCRC